jgi:hypothetical protein
MPSRLIREGILTSERVDQLDAAAEVFYRRLMSKVDDHGLYDARPAILRSSLYPLRVDRVREADITRWIAACEKAGVIALYTYEGKPYLQMLDTRWSARSEPKFPLPSTNNTGEQFQTISGNSKQVKAIENTCKQLKTPVALDVVVDEDVFKEANASLSGSSMPDCPHQKILEIYGKHLPHLAQHRTWEGHRQTSLRARWVQASAPSSYSPKGYKTTEEGLAWWNDFFAYIANETKLAAGFESNGRLWLPDLEWIVKSANFNKIIDGKYDK